MRFKYIAWMIAVLSLVACSHKKSKPPFQHDMTYDVPEVHVQLQFDRWDDAAFGGKWVPWIEAPQQCPDCATAPELEARIKRAIADILRDKQAKGLPRPTYLAHGQMTARVRLGKTCTTVGEWNWEGKKQNYLDMGIKAWRCGENKPTMKADQLSWACHRTFQMLFGCPNCMGEFARVGGC